MSTYPKLAALALSLLGQNVLAEPLGLGRAALPDEIKAWDIDVRPDGMGLPPGQGSVREGDALFQERCAACHGEFGEGAGRWPALAGGKGSLKSERPEKTIGSFWPFATTVYDYIYRAMPFGNAQSLTPNDTYALVAYLLNLNDAVKEDFILSDQTFAAIRLENQTAFYDDDREQAERQFWSKAPCMKDCKPEVRILSRARALEVTPADEKNAAKGE
jgi:S-disulfanyl-L-cysteine oxidoreductase SoxD